MDREDDETDDMTMNTNGEIDDLDDIDDYDMLEEIEVNDEDITELTDSDDDEAVSDCLPLPSPAETDDSIFTFSKHKGAVFACAMLPKYNLCATGGEDDIVYVWNYCDGRLLHQINWHNDSVTELHFNHNDKYLASGDMAGAIVLHRIKETNSNIEFMQKMDILIGDMCWMLLHPFANILICGCECGDIYVSQFPSGYLKAICGNGTRCECGILTNDGQKLLAAYGNGCIKLWDIKNSTALMETSSKNSSIHHTGPLVAADINLTSMIFATGGEDCKVIFSTPNGAVSSLSCNGSIECLAFSPSKILNVIAIGTLKGEIIIFDYSKDSVRCTCANEGAEGVTKIQWINDVTILAATMMGNIFGYDARSGQQIFTLSGNNNVIYNFIYDSVKSILLTVSECGGAKIFKVPQSALTE